MKRLVVTGASGLIGTELAHAVLKKDSDDFLYLVSTHSELLKEKYRNNPRIACTTIDEFEQDTKECSCVIHFAFSRSNDPESVVKSIDYTERVIHAAKIRKVSSFINISSQSIYGTRHTPLWNEKMNAAPTEFYAFGKYASEIMTRVAFQETNINWTSIRLASVCENARFVNTFVENMINGMPIIVAGGTQLCSLIDIRDAVSGILNAVETCERHKFKETYNLGTGVQTSIVEIADLVNKIGHEVYHLPLTSIQIEPKDVFLNVGMDNRLFQTEFKWKPVFEIEDMIRAVFEIQMTKRTGQE